MYKSLSRSLAKRNIYYKTYSVSILHLIFHYIPYKEYKVCEEEKILDNGSYESLHGTATGDYYWLYEVVWWCLLCWQRGRKGVQFITMPLPLPLLHSSATTKFNVWKDLIAGSLVQQSNRLSGGHSKTGPIKCTSPLTDSLRPVSIPDWGPYDYQCQLGATVELRIHCNYESATSAQHVT